jgi:RNA polymerase sigma-70 factor (ECF subfamily)
VAGLPVELNPTLAIEGPTDVLTFEQTQRLSDEQLMACLKAGQNDPLAVLFDRYERLVLSIALKIVRDPGEAEDVTQTVFIDIFRAVAQFDPARGTAKVWLMQYAYNRAIHRRKHLATRHFYDCDAFKELEDSLSDGHMTHGLNAPESKAVVRKILAALPQAQRSVIEQASYQGLTLREIADKTGDSFANVQHHYYRGLKKLRALVAGGNGNQSINKRENNV